MILVIKNIDESGIERMYVVCFGEILEYFGNFFVVTLVGKLNFSHVEGSDSGNGITRVHNCRSLSLSLGEQDVDEFFRRRDRTDLFEIIVHMNMIYNINKISLIIQNRNFNTNLYNLYNFIL